MEVIDIRTAKEHIVSASLYKAAKSRSILIIVCAMGVKQTYYQNFAAFMSKHNISVFIFDYSGIGRSAWQPLRRCKSNLADWGSVDLEAVICYAKARFPAQPVVILGHSLGGQLIGLARSSPVAWKIILVATQSGYWKFWRGAGLVRMWINWHVIIPLLVRLFGYLPAKAISKMENLPKHVAKQWSRWGRKPDYLFGTIARDELYFKDIEAELLAISIHDDYYAPKAAVDWFAGRYERARVKRWHLTPADYQVQRIGHFGLFRPEFKNIFWQKILEEIER